MASTNTSWEGAGQWYQALVEEETSYQKNLILPNLLRLLSLQGGERILDLGCGTGFFSQAFFEHGARVIGVDLAPELIKLAKQRCSPEIKFYAAEASRLPFIKDASVNIITLILALQNMEGVGEILKEGRRVLAKEGRIVMVLTHPCFRVPKGSSWGYDEAEKTQFRRIDYYLSESKIKVQMHPGEKPEECTLSLHRPLQFYFKALRKAGFCVSGLEEWNSNLISKRAKELKQRIKRVKKFLCFFL